MKGSSVTTSEFDAAAAHRHFATDCFNRVWEMLEKPDRSADEDRMMVAMSHASLFHWQQRADCTPRNLSVGYWLISRVYDEPYLTGNAKDEWLKTLNAGWWQHLEADSPLPIE